MKKLIILILALNTFACSDKEESSSTGGGSTNTNLIAQYNILQGRLTSIAQVPLSGLIVQLKGADFILDSVTDSTGVYSIALTEDQFDSLPKEFSLLYSGSNTIPGSIEFTKDDGAIGGQLFTPVTQSVMQTSDRNGLSITLIDEVTHLGDSNYEGAVNSQFQIPIALSESIERKFQITQQNIDSADQVTLTIKARGIEMADKIEIFAPNSTTPVYRATLRDSPIDGSSASQIFDIPRSALAVGEMRVVITSALNLYDDYDDFELLSGELYLGEIACPLTPADANQTVYANLNTFYLCVY